jgi:hypothetical protein
MNAGSLSLYINIVMKASLFLKVFIILPLILLADYIFIAIPGCTTCLFGLGNEFYCGPFCLAWKIILALSAVFIGYLIYPDIKALIKSKKNVEATESKKD